MALVTNPVFINQQDPVKLNQFDGTNFIRWKDKMKFLLTTLKVFYVLDPNLQPLAEPTPEDTDLIKEEKKKRAEDGLVCRGHILNSLTDRLYDLYSNYAAPKEIWTALETKYQNEKKGTDKFLALNYFDFKMTDDMPVMDQVHELQILVSRLRDLEVTVPDTLQIGAILSKLPPSWNNYRKKVLQTPESFTMEQFQTHLQIECETRIRDEKLQKEKAMNSNVNSHVNAIGSNSRKSGNKFVKYQNKLKVQKTGGFKKFNNKKNKACFHCGKKGHYIKDCRIKIAEDKRNKDNSSGQSAQANIVVKEDMNFVAMVTELNMATNAGTMDWFLDSGATIHVCNNKEFFRTYIEDDSEVFMGNHAPVKVLGKGNVILNFTSGQKLTLVNVHHVPDVKRNLVSANLLCKRGFKIVLESDKFVISKNVVFVGKGYSLDGMFKLSINNINIASAYMVESSTLWHARLGHLNYVMLKYMSNHNYISCKHDYLDKCEICAQAKITRKPFPKVEHETKLLELIHSDICELNGKLTSGGNRYFITFIDNCSRYTSVYLLSNKDEAFDKFKEFKSKVENQKERKIKIIRSDRGGEYFSIEFDKFCEDHGIIHQKSAPFTPQQNGLAERKNRTLVDMVNAMILNAALPFNLWGEALLTACYIHNRVPSKRTHISPYEIWNGRKPNLNYFKVWGCIAYYRLPDSQRTKLGSRGIKSVFIGYAQNSKAYRLLDLESNVIVESIHVEFFENSFVKSQTMNEPEKDQNTSIAYDPLTKRKDTIEPSEPRRSQRTRKEKYLDSDFISPDQITFLVEGNRDRILRKMKILLNIEDEPKTLSEALASRDSAF